MSVPASFSTDVVIVGAGPSGLALANTLARAGIRHVVLEKLTQIQNTSRAAVVHAHTLEVLDGIGVSDRLMAEGLQLSRFTIRERDRALADLRFDKLPTRYPKILMIPQDRTEAILADALSKVGASVLRGYTVDSVEDTGDHVRVVASSKDERRSFNARYVIGADGMHSVVRKAAGIGFTGSAYEDSFVLADVELESYQGGDEVRLFFSPAGMIVVAPLPDRKYRIVASMAEAPERPGSADIQALLDSRGPESESAKVTRVLWSSRFRLHHRVADAYRNGRLFLVGDAAHVHSPAGGQGMNTGLVDACVLGRILAEVISGQRGETFLDEYQRLRRPAAIKVLKLAGRLTMLATMKHGPQRALRNFILSMVNRVPSLRRRLEMGLSGLSRRSAIQLPGDADQVSSSGHRSRPSPPADTLLETKSLP